MVEDRDIEYAEGKDDVVAVLLHQHVRIRELFAEVKGAEGESRQRAFDELRVLLAAHETAEEMVVRPATRRAAGDDVADARNHEEDAANQALAELEKLDVDSAEFRRGFAEFEKAVVAHAEREEAEEFPALRRKVSKEDRHKMAESLVAAEKIAPTHPHPSTAGSTTAQWAVGPFVSLVDRARDALKSAMPG